MMFRQSTRWMLECSTHRVEVWHTDKHQNLTEDVKAIFNEFGSSGNHWTIYISIFKNHPYYDNWKTPEDLAFLKAHSGLVKLEEVFSENGSVIRFGCDYDHIYDQEFTFMEPEDFANSEVQADALRMFDLLHADDGTQST